MAEYIEREALRAKAVYMHGFGENKYVPLKAIENAPAADVVPVKHGRTYTAHEVAEILADEYGDTCACNFNGNDEWLPMKCELLDDCPNPVGVACWEQFLKWRDSKEVDNG